MDLLGSMQAGQILVLVNAPLQKTSRARSGRTPATWKCDPPTISQRVLKVICESSFRPHIDPLPTA